METDTEKFTLLAMRIAVGASVKDASEQLQIPRTTSYRWSASPTFRTKVSEIRSELLGAAIGRMTDSAVVAVDVLVELMTDASQKASDRIAAAKSLLAAMQGLSSLGELRDRIDAIEKDLNHAE